MRRMIVGATLACFVIAIGGCDRLEPSPQQAPGAVMLRIVNDNRMHVEVYLARNTSPHRLVHVCDLGRADVTLAPQLIAEPEITLLATIVETGETLQTASIATAGPMTIELYLAKEWKNSTYRVRSGTDTSTAPLPLRRP